MPKSEEAAIINGLKDDAQQALPDIAKSAGKFADNTADRMDGSLAAHAETETGNEDLLNAAGKRPAGDPAVGEPKPKVMRTKTDGSEEPIKYHQFTDKELEDAGIKSKGADDVETGGTDPVDVVSGQLVASTTDLVRHGVLPLVLHRAYASGYESGGLFGTGWASTLDIRLVVDADGIRFLGENAQTLDYGMPAGLALGLPSFPVHGARWPLTRDAEHYRVEDPSTGQTWVFPREVGAADAAASPVHPLLEIRDRNGRIISFLRDERGIPAQIAHSAGYVVQVTTVETPAGPRIAALSLSPGGGLEDVALVAYSYDEAGRLASITDSSGVPYLYHWDEHDRICGWTDRNGYAYHYEYDEHDRVVRCWGDGGYMTSTLVYDKTNRVTTVTNGLDQSSAYHYDAFQQVTRIVDPLGGEQLIERDRFGRVSAATNEVGSTARTERNADGLPLMFIGADGATTSLEYNGLGLPVRITEPNSAQWVYEYDERGKLVRSTDPLGAQVSYEYDEYGALAAINDALGARSTCIVDAAGLPIAVTNPLGATWRMERDAFGRVVATTDPTGATRRAVYGTEGQVLREQDAAGASVSYTYDPSGNLIERVDETGAATRFEYGPMGLRSAVTDPLGARYAFTYDSDLRLTTVTGPSGLEWTYTYDAAGRLVAERDFDGRELSYRLDAAGRLVERLDALGRLTSFEYDPVGRLTRQVTGTIDQRFAYDPVGNLVRAEGPGALLEFSYDLYGRPIAESLNGRSVRRTYDLEGNLLTRTTPSGAISSWTYDAAGNPQTLAAPGGGVSFGYDVAGREISRMLARPETVLTRSYDQAGRWAGSRLTQDGVSLQEYGYRFRADGAVEHIADRLRGDRAYTLDAIGRVGAVTAEGWTETYAYDPLGNLASAAGEARTIVGTQVRQDGRTSYTYDAEGRLVTKQRRTLSGQSLKWTYSWDELGHLTRVETPDHGIWTYSYDPLGRRFAKSGLDVDGTPVSRSLFSYDGPRLVEETTQDPRSGRVTRTVWEYEPDSLTPLTQTRYRPHAHDGGDGETGTSFVDEQFYAIVADLVGTPTELVTVEGNLLPIARRDLWGRPVAPEDDDPCALRFPGQYCDSETGLHYNLHRYYDPELAGYLSPDPLGLIPGPNQRAYVGNPLTEADPLGLNAEGANHNPDTPVPAPNLSSSSRVEYGTDPMSKLAIQARKSEGWLRGGRNVAVMLYHDDAGNKGAIGALSDGTHSERLDWKAVAELHGIRPDQVDKIYTELQPCSGKGMPNCDKWLNTNFNGVPVSHSFDYGPTTASRTAGMKELHKALTQIRKGNLPK